MKLLEYEKVIKRQEKDVLYFPVGFKEKEQAAVKCPSCSESLAGFKGETATCPYCGTKITL